jgi:alanine racemase
MNGTFCEINLNSFQQNIETIRKLVGNSEILPIIKSNAYGHGIIPISKKLNELGINVLGVAWAEEGKKIRLSGCDSKIHIIVPPLGSDIDTILDYDLQCSVSRVEFCEKLSEKALLQNKTVTVHVFLNTGMNRDGIDPKTAVEFMDKISKLKGINIEGLQSHFCSADSTDLTYSQKQLDTFNNTAELLEISGYKFNFKHIANSAGILQLPESHHSMVRPGIFIYGYQGESFLQEKVNLHPVMTLKSHVIEVRDLKEGETTGYSFRYIADRDTKIAVISTGYGDGYSRAHTNKSSVIINDRRYPIIGTVCMDEIMINLGKGNDSVKIGDEVILMGKSETQEISIYELASNINTIPYEITTALTERVKRVYID